MIFTTTTLIIIGASSSLTFGSILGFILGDRRRRNLERDRHYEDLVYYLENDDYDITETEPI